MNFKKGLISAVLCAICLLPLAAQENSKKFENTADISYQYAPIYKILDSADTYVVIYGKYGAKIGTVMIPKKWAQWQKNEPRKLTFRNTPPKMQSFITIVKKDGEFHKVILTVPPSKLNPIWGIASATKTSSEGVETIELDL